MSNEILDKVVSLIEQRKTEVLAANNLSDDEESVQSVWVTGIYNDLAEYIKVNI